MVMIPSQGNVIILQSMAGAGKEEDYVAVPLQPALPPCGRLHHYSRPGTGERTALASQPMHPPCLCSGLSLNGISLLSLISLALSWTSERCWAKASASVSLWSSCISYTLTTCIYSPQTASNPSQEAMCPSEPGWVGFLNILRTPSSGTSCVPQVAAPSKVCLRALLQSPAPREDGGCSLSTNSSGQNKPLTWLE